MARLKVKHTRSQGTTVHCDGGDIGRGRAVKFPLTFSAKEASHLGALKRKGDSCEKVAETATKTCRTHEFVGQVGFDSAVVSGLRSVD